MLGNAQESSTSHEILADYQIHLTEEHIRTYIKNLIDNLYLYNLLDPGNAVSLCIIGMLGLHRDFHAFKKAVESTLLEYKSSANSLHTMFNY